MSIIDIKTQLNIADTDTEYDAYLTRLYNMGQVFVRNRVGIPNVMVRTYTYRNVNGATVFKCPDFPINSVVSAKADDEDIIVTAEEYNFVTDTAVFCNKLQITANTGLSALPLDLEQIVNLIVEHIWNLTSKSVQINQNGNISLSPEQLKFPQYIYEFLDSWSWT